MECEHRQSFDWHLPANKARFLFFFWTILFLLAGGGETTTAASKEARNAELRSRKSRGMLKEMRHCKKNGNESFLRIQNASLAQGVFFLFTDIWWCIRQQIKGAALQSLAQHHCYWNDDKCGGIFLLKTRIAINHPLHPPSEKRICQTSQAMLEHPCDALLGTKQKTLIGVPCRNQETIFCCLHFKGHWHVTVKCRPRLHFTPWHYVYAFQPLQIICRSLWGGGSCYVARLMCGKKWFRSPVWHSSSRKLSLPLLSTGGFFWVRSRKI